MAIDDSLELDNFETLTRDTIPRPGEIPEISGFDIYGESIPIGGPVGGENHLLPRIRHVRMPTRTVQM